MNRPTLAACIIAKNEAENLPRLFKSLEGCVDKIYLTDTGSTDKTIEVAKELGAEVSHFEWVDDFSAARNFNLQQVKEDYAFWIDCDDVLENKEAFVTFRDHVMHLNDYWLATYHYTSDKNGKPLCSFARERVFKTTKGFYWKYFLHEGITPESPYPDIKVQFTPAWVVRHLRTDEDLLKDRSRNLNIFEFQKGKKKLDARMTYYYGKELFEAGKAFDSIIQFTQAMADPKLELHDRILCTQYCCYAYIQCNQFEKCIDTAHMGLELDPTRAEFHTVIADAYVKLNKFVNAVPFYHAAKNCVNQIPNGYSAAIFKTEDMYGVYPSNQLTKIWAQLGSFEEARKEAAWCIQKYDNEEAKKLLSELTRVDQAVEGYKTAEPCDDIIITTAPQNAYEWDGDIAKEKAMGGSETAAIEMAYWLKVLSGRNVKIFNMRETDKVSDGIEYISNKKLIEYTSKHKPYLHIAWRHNIKVTNAPTFLWCHDLTTPGAEAIQNYEKIMCLTPFHKKYVMTMQGIPENKIYVTSNGINPDKFQMDPIEKDPYRFIFSSSPDRGLDRTMRVLDKVREKHPEVTLHVYYGIEHLHKYGLQALQDKLKAMMEERKDWVVYHGAMEQKQMYMEFMKAAYCVQPSDWIETSMISAIERLACGVYQIMRAVGGCVDTLAEPAKLGMCTLVDSECITELEYNKYVEATLQAIEEEAYKKVRFPIEVFHWKRVAAQWLEDLPKIAYGDTV